MKPEEKGAKVTRWHSITTRQALVTFVIALLLSAGTGVFQLVSDARMVRAETREDMERLLNLVEGSAAEAAFQLNPDLANQVVEGLYNYRSVRYVSLRDDFGRVLMEKGDASSEQAGVLLQALFGDVTHYQKSLDYSVSRTPEPLPVGQLRLVLSAASIGESYVQRGRRLFLLGIVEALSIAVLVVLVFHFLITRPLLSIYRAIAAVSLKQPGRWPRPNTPHSRRDELGRLVRELDNLMQAFQKGLDQRDALHQISTIDGLTGIPNRRFFDDFLEKCWYQAADLSQPLSLIFIDIDYFKPFNDNYGHAVGDDCLRSVARALSGALTRPTDIVARYGGEEFVCVLPGTDLDGARAVAQRIRHDVNALAIPHSHSEAAPYVTVSMGVAGAVPGDNEVDMIRLLEIADHRLYLAKDQGRNRCVWHD
ncbi:diguanylate cyclase [Marinobacter sp. SS13-12]|uniref:GGDEF domain-containing protein n=1 Tax=Marinobacter sp. SS13-12 TaxID=3050451 RepID=UPI002554E4A0|nr:diguanylate cyclase [Marinobacter sp. SS13-12]MDK8465542.1 diguanylate cyclase [Marinobacter sp. SS13-12]